MNEEKFMHSMPCQRVNTNGYFFGSVLNLTVPTTCRSTLDSRAIAPVRNVPAGTTTCPPFASLHALIARAKAAVLSVLPSPVAPNAVTSKVRSGKMGGTIPASVLPSHTSCPFPRSASVAAWREGGTRHRLIDARQDWPE